MYFIENKHDMSAALSVKYVSFQSILCLHDIDNVLISYYTVFRLFNSNSISELC